MGKARNIMITIGASVAVGVVIGMLYAPVEGSEARKKIRALKRKLTCEEDIDDDRETLEELSTLLQKELRIVNEKLEKR